VSLTNDHLRRLASVVYARGLGFVELAGLAELDPATAFQRANLHGADLRGQDLSGFDFTDANLDGCDLTGADLSRTLGVTPAMLARATHDATTLTPRAWFWANARPPAWADDWGHDTLGPWVTIRIPGTEITQRFRWCPKGDFMMGSDDTDPDADEDEKPRHRVSFATGFWMADTTCSQAVWTAVMGEPPGHTWGPAFPITDVDWNQAQDFIRTLRDRLPGLPLALPSEAEWEYACRAGTETPYSFGTRITKKQVCYGSDSPAPGGRLPPNPWGLHEMHGNIYEWCEDEGPADYAKTPRDGAPWRDASERSGDARRVIRGGAWLFVARDVRSAGRGGRGPGDRGNDLGFRFALVQRASSGALAAPARPDGIARRCQD